MHATLAIISLSRQWRNAPSITIAVGRHGSAGWCEQDTCLARRLQIGGLDKPCTQGADYDRGAYLQKQK